MKNFVKHQNASKYYDQDCRTTWNELEPPGMSCNYLEQGETTYNEMESATN